MEKKDLQNFPTEWEVNSIKTNSGRIMKNIISGSIFCFGSKFAYILLLINRLLTSHFPISCHPMKKWLLFLFCLYFCILHPPLILRIDFTLGRIFIKGICHHLNDEPTDIPVTALGSRCSVEPRIH